MLQKASCVSICGGSSHGRKLCLVKMNRLICLTDINNEIIAGEARSKSIRTDSSRPWQVLIACAFFNLNIVSEELVLVRVTLLLCETAS